ncbi:hypothetical protein BJ928_110146 [Rhizobium sp. WW_1]|mgnify:CR=1 FL=1|jgi:hypothetical protein|nr:hypothetical protein BJ928_110146 [Rhizobium sp. WW_1]
MERRAPSSEATARRTAAKPKSAFHSKIVVNFTVQLAVELINALPSITPRNIPIDKTGCGVRYRKV